MHVQQWSLKIHPVFKFDNGWWETREGLMVRAVTMSGGKSYYH